MSWTLQAAGNCDASEEHEFASALQELLAYYGATESQLSGGTVNGPVHVVPKAAKGSKEK